MRVLAIACAFVVSASVVACQGRHAAGKAASAQDDTGAAPPDTAPNRSSSDTILAPTDRAVAAAAHAAAAPPPAPPPRVLTPLADTISQYLVFAPTVQTWFLAAKRGKRLLVDIGRVDTDVRHDHHRALAFAEAVDALTPVPKGSMLRLFGQWGQDTVAITGFGDWNGRIVATIAVSPHLDSLVRAAPVAFAAVERIDTTARADSVPRDTSSRGDSIRVADSTHQ